MLPPCAYFAAQLCTPTPSCRFLGINSVLQNLGMQESQSRSITHCANMFKTAFAQLRQMSQTIAAPAHCACTFSGSNMKAFSRSPSLPSCSADFRRFASTKVRWCWHRLPKSTPIYTPTKQFIHHSFHGISPLRIQLTASSP